MPERIIDACCLINLYASGSAAEILAASGGVYYVSDEVRGEALTTRRPDPLDPPKLQTQPIDLTAGLQAGWLNACSLEGSEEFDAYLEFAQQLDDGEASCLAIAKARQWKVATDDRKAIRICSEHGIQVITTPELVKRWAEKSKPTDIRAVIANIERFASFRPGRTHPLHPWWLEFSE
ncbi:MAG: hypothetical protein JNL18_18100 [Planctomycetaceae bacterium]|nr:hypothetical protein [Planctomycetaceae bacterium]